VNGAPKVVLAVASVVVPVVTVNAASGPTATDKVVVPVLFWACASPVNASRQQANIVAYRINFSSPKLH
jgi:hypothetical protein